MVFVFTNISKLHFKFSKVTACTVYNCNMKTNSTLKIFSILISQFDIYFQGDFDYPYIIKTIDVIDNIMTGMIVYIQYFLALKM